MKKAMISYLNTFFGKKLELRVRLFHVLAITGVIICIAMTAVSIAGKMWVSTFINAGTGLISLFLLLYSAKTRRYSFCYYMTIVVIFLILFPSLFFSGGGYQGGMPFFFVFAVVFTVYMLDGWPMLAVTFAEMLFYAHLCMLAYHRPELVIPFGSEEAVVTDVIIGLITVSISLGATMFVQVRMYKTQQEKLENAQKAAESASEAKSVFLANMSHEIRTPIHMILGMNEIIHRETRSIQVRDYSEKIDDTSKMLLSLVDSVLDVSKIESGKMELIPVCYESANLVRTLLLIGKANCKGKGLRFYTEVSEDLPPQLYGDMAHLRQIATNLLSNAAKYTKKGSITMHIYWKPTEDPERILLCLSIADTGIGIAQEALPTLFDAFSRADLASHRTIEGTGLGLKIVKELTDLMGGNISVSSQQGVGSTFQVEIPQTVQKEGDTQKQNAAMTFEAPKARILVVDDNEGNCQLMQELLSPTKMRVDTAISGSRCLELVERNAYDLILMDYMMPEMNGLEVLRELQKRPDFRTPVVALTADATSDTEQKLMSGGFASYLTKPIPWGKLRDALLSFLPETLVTQRPEGNTSAEVVHDQLDRILLPYGVETEQAAPYFDNNLSQYAAMAALFLSRDPEEQQKVRSLWDQKDWENLRFPIHALKGKAKNLGLCRLSEICAHLEQLCGSGETGELHSLMPYLFYLWEQGSKGLGILVREVQPKQEAKTEKKADPQALRECLRGFKRKPSLECLNAMKAEEETDAGQALLDEIRSAVQAIAFDRAEEALDRYLQWKEGGTAHVSGPYSGRG